MKHHSTFTVRCRAIILHEDRMLTVRHSPDAKHVVLPGGHLDFGEDVQACIKRELMEELGVEAAIGRLLYVNCFKEDETAQTVEFIFEVTNGVDFVGCENLERSHAKEIEEICWLTKTDAVQLLPSQVQEDFRNGSIFNSEVRYIGISC